MPTENETCPVVSGQLRRFTGLFGATLKFPFVIVDISPPNVGILYDGCVYIHDISMIKMYSEVMKDA